MPRYTVELTYLVPVYRHVTVDVADPEDAPQAACDAMNRALAGEPIPDRLDYENPTIDFCTGIWSGDEAHDGEPHEIPDTWSRDARLAEDAAH